MFVIIPQKLVMKKTLLISACILFLLAATALLTNSHREAKWHQKSSSGKCSKPATPKPGTGFLITDAFSGFF